MDTSKINTLFTNLVTAGTGLGVAVATFFLVWGGYLYMSAGGSPRQMESGKQAITNAIIGLVIVFAANAISRLVYAALGGG